MVHVKYNLQLPNINIRPFQPRYTPKGSARMKVDLSPIEMENGFNYIPSIPEMAISGVWLSAALNSFADCRRLNLREFKFHNIVKSELNFFDHVTEQSYINYNELYHLTGCLNTLLVKKPIRFDLFTLPSWELFKKALSLGYSIMVGGSVYESFEKARDTGVVPMPRPGENLLNGHLVNIVSGDVEEDTFSAIANRGFNFGYRGVIRFRGSYLRNLQICRDFFILVPRKAYGYNT